MTLWIDRIGNQKSINKQLIISSVPLYVLWVWGLEIVLFGVGFIGMGDHNFMIFGCFWRPGMPEHPQGRLLDDSSRFL